MHTECCPAQHRIHLCGHAPTHGRRRTRMHSHIGTCRFSIAGMSIWVKLGHILCDNLRGSEQIRPGGEAVEGN